uniref:Uncharacterized protein n=1 Tax=Anguilla anguilla TaxID=7936 RepID=A0A0E9PGT7_ANGAN
MNYCKGALLYSFVLWIKDQFL